MIKIESGLSGVDRLLNLQLFGDDFLHLSSISIFFIGRLFLNLFWYLNPPVFFLFLLLKFTDHLHPFFIVRVEMRPKVCILGRFLGRQTWFSLVHSKQFSIVFSSLITVGCLCFMRCVRRIWNILWWRFPFLMRWTAYLASSSMHYIAGSLGLCF